MATRNTGNSQPIDATAYDTPNTVIDRRPPLRPPLSSRGRRTLGSNPRGMTTPTRISVPPITSDTQGATSYTERVTRLTISPITANVATKPVVTAVPTTR